MDEHAKHLHGMMDDLLPPHGSAADADALDALLGGDLQDAELWNAPALFGTLAPGLQCSEACHRPGQRCLDPTHSAHCTKCVRGPLPGPPARFCAFFRAGSGFVARTRTASRAHAVSTSAAAQRGQTRRGRPGTVRHAGRAVARASCAPAGSQPRCQQPADSARLSLRSAGASRRPARPTWACMSWWARPARRTARSDFGAFALGFRGLFSRATP
jgi:hypothetical protein